MAGMFQGGPLGKIGRMIGQKGIGGRLIGAATGDKERGADLFGVFAKDPANPYAPRTTQVDPKAKPKSEPNRRGVRRRVTSPRVNSVLTPDSTRTQYDLVGGK
jgi:hypothetical protein